MFLAGVNDSTSESRLVDTRRQLTRTERNRTAQRLAGECHRVRCSSEFRVCIGARPKSLSLPFFRWPAGRRRRLAHSPCLPLFPLPPPSSVLSACAIDASIMSESESRRRVSLGSGFFRNSIHPVFKIPSISASNLFLRSDPKKNLLMNA